MKRKTKNSVKILAEVIDQKKLKPYYKGIAHIYMGYALITSNSFESALKEYAKAENFAKKLGKSSLFNRLLCKGMIGMEKKNYEEALAFFAEAQKICKMNREIVFYKSSAMVMLFLRTTEKMQLNASQKDAYFQAVKSEFDSKIRQFRNDHFLHFYRGIISLYIHDFVSALNDFEKSIQASEEANAKYHMFRGLAYACMSMFKEAMKDLSAAVKLKDDFMLAYHNRGKCAYLLGDTNLAFMDFQKLILISPVYI